MDSTVIVAVISGIFACISAVIAAVKTLQKRKFENEHEKDLQRIENEHEKDLKEQRLNLEKNLSKSEIKNNTAVDMSSLIVEAQKGLSEGFKSQLNQSNKQYRNLREEFDDFKEEANRDKANLRNKFEEFKGQSNENRRKLEHTVHSLEIKIKKFTKVLSAINHNLKIMGLRINDLRTDIDKENDEELFEKLNQLRSIHGSILSSLDSVDLAWNDIGVNKPKDVLIDFNIEPLEDEKENTG